MNWLDIIIIVCVAAGIIKGLFDGFVKQAVSFLALILAIFFAGRLAGFLRYWALNSEIFSSMSYGILTGVCYTLAFMLIIVVVVLLGKIVNIVVKMTPAKPLNILLGGLFGMFIWILSLSILFNIFAVFDSSSAILSTQTQEKSVFYMRIKGVAPTVYPALKNYFKYSS
ncbi:MAG: CvpA family protein [Dysgonamonadaceae bacterium]|nr:CvpA family protein [Dysgonamonadaceae bacterium]